jgi:hypothetical protein
MNRLLRNPSVTTPRSPDYTVPHKYTTPYLFKHQFNVALPPASVSQTVYLNRLSDQSFLHISHLSHACCMRHPPHSLSSYEIPTPAFLFERYAMNLRHIAIMAGTINEMYGGWAAHACFHTAERIVKLLTWCGIDEYGVTRMPQIHLLMFKLKKGHLNNGFVWHYTHKQRMS